ncbi:hypothetical protein [Flammeovirga aprica]|uniref:Uncharacterized protein n=1 Tax=Flammeovirga aprica JL-4 TaxID=694437 RepID=A0A7X9S235_9BACT|nr:hypothetical protein [Flammeovirga aprica]NME72976.1 hypothetical protein [Flammeovirga aprica JL-4]
MKKTIVFIGILGSIFFTSCNQEFEPSTKMKPLEKVDYQYESIEIDTVDVPRYMPYTGIGEGENGKG